MPLDLVNFTGLTTREAMRLQEEGSKLVSSKTEVTLDDLTLIGGTDISYIREDSIAIGAVVVYSHPELDLMERKACVVRVDFPYVPGLLSFRELPALLIAIKFLESTPQLFLVDGQGLAHPRFFGIASHLGVVLNQPTIGCAKSRLLGSHEEPGPNPGDWAPLRYKEKIVGAALRTRFGVKPIYISTGHLISLEDAIAVILSCTKGYRLPEPQRMAHRLTTELKTVFRAEGMGALKKRVSRINQRKRL